MEVVVWNDDIETAIRKFKKRVINSGLLKELKRASFAASRTQRRKVKDQVAFKRFKRNQRKRERNE